VKRIYIVADMEGISGITNAAQLKPETPAWGEARAFLASDVNAALDGAFGAGAEEVVVCDFHWLGVANLPMEKMDARAIYEQPYKHLLMPGMADGFSGLFVIGAHAMAGTLGAFQDHTMAAETWFRYKLGGSDCGEIGICAAYAGHFEVPLLLVAGDAAACREAEEFVPGVETVAVKEAVCRELARTVHPGAAVKLIREAAGRALERAGEVEPSMVDLPNEVELEYARTEFADEAARRAGAERVGPRSIRREIGSTLDLVKGF